MNDGFINDELSCLGFSTKKCRVQSGKNRDFEIGEV